MLRLAPLVVLLAAGSARAQDAKRTFPYADAPHERQVLDVYAPKGAKNLPVVFWIHGGGWQAGDKSDVQDKPAWFLANGFVFVSTNYRLLPAVDMGTLIRDVAKAVGWTRRNIAQHGGDPDRLYIMGHSAGAQLAAILCTDDRYLRAEGVPFTALRGCVPVDGDTFDVPAIIATAEARWRAHGLPAAKFGHREKFGNDAEKHKDFSAVTHAAKGKNIPPFLVMHVAEHPDVTAQARRLAAALQAADVPVTLYAARDSTHRRINADLGKADDPGTAALLAFVKR